MSENRNSAGGLGFFTVLTLIFITLKLCGLIDWSWWLVLAPIWISWSVVLVTLAIIGIVASIIYMKS